METKKCNKCGEVKSTDQFGTRDGGKYLRSYCKRCEADRRIRRYHESEKLRKPKKEPKLLKLDGEDAKRCKKCGEVKVLSMFYRQPKGVGGVGTKCKTCTYTSVKTCVVELEIDGKMVEAKRCKKCGETKPLDDFPFQKGGIGGRRGTCRMCLRKTPLPKKPFKKVIDGVEVEVKECTKCGVVKTIDNFHKNHMTSHGYTSSCKACNREYRRKAYPKMREKHLEKIRKRAIISVNRRRTRERYLPSTLSVNEYDKMMETFDYSCAITEDSENLSLDHFIPISWGHGGTYMGNVYPISKRLNSMKTNLNPFEWVKSEGVAELIDKDKWDKLVNYLAEQNNMTTQEFREYVYWCEANKRSIKDLEKDSTPSLELWKRIHAVQH